MILKTNWKWLLVGYAFLDLIVTIVFTIRRYDSLIDAEINPLHTAAYWYGYSLALLIGCIGIGTSTRWGYQLAVIASVGLAAKIVLDWSQFSQTLGEPMMSLKTISYWWEYATMYKWNLVRLPISLLLAAYSTKELVRTTGTRQRWA